MDLAVVEENTGRVESDDRVRHTWEKNGGVPEAIGFKERAGSRRVRIIIHGGPTDAIPRPDGYFLRIEEEVKALNFVGLR